MLASDSYCCASRLQGALHHGDLFSVAQAELVDWTGRPMRVDKRGAIDDAQPAILARVCARRQTRFLHGMRATRRVLG
jgi:hypothetical protein